MTDDINAKMPTSLKEALEILKDSGFQEFQRSRSGRRNLARFVDLHVNDNQDATEETHLDLRSDSTSRTVINFRSKISHVRYRTETSIEKTEVDATPETTPDDGMAKLPAMSLAASTHAVDEKLESTSISICVNGKNIEVFKIGDRVLISSGGETLAENLVIADFIFPLSPSELGAAYLELQGLKFEQLKRLIVKFGRPKENEIDART